MTDDNSEYGPKQAGLFPPTQPVYQERLSPSKQLGRLASWLAYHATHTPGYVIEEGRVVAASPDSGLVEKLSEE